MRTPTWETSTGALAAFLNSTTQCYMADLYTITLSGGQVLRYTDRALPVTINGATYSPGPLLRRGKTRMSVGIAVDTLDLTLSADATVTVNGVPILQFVAGGGFDGATLLLERAFAPAPPTAEPRRNVLVNSQNFLASSWMPYWEGAVVESGYLAPDGSSTASKITPVTTGAHPTSSGIFNTGSAPLVSGLQVSVWLRSDSPGDDLVFGIGDPGALTVTLQNDWQRYSGVVDHPSDYFGRTFTMHGAGTSSAPWYAWGAQVEVANTPTDYQRIDATYTPANPWVGTVGLFSGRVGPSGSNRYDAQLTVNSDIELLNVMVPRNVYQPGCNNTLFDAACGLAKSAFAASATASGATDATLTTFATSTTLADSYFAQGWAVGATGANAGVARTIKANGTNSLQTIRPWAAPVAAGDTFVLYPGCDKKQATCSAKFANLARFRGQPYVPAPETVT